MTETERSALQAIAHDENSSLNYVVRMAVRSFIHEFADRPERKQMWIDENGDRP